MARIRLGDIVPLYVPGRPDVSGGPQYPMVPSLPPDLAANFVASYNPSNTIPAYAASEETNPAMAHAVTGGPYFVPAQPNNPAPFSNIRSFDGSAPYKREAILPDQILPAPLKRESQILKHQQALWEPTRHDLALLRQSAVWRWISEHGGLKGCCRIPELGAPVWAIPPWIQKPSNGLDFEKMFFQPLTAFQTLGVFNGVDTVIGQWRVPNAWDGAIKKVVFGFTGDGHIEGSGDIVWRLKIGQRFANDFGKVLNTYGSLQTALLVQQQNIQVISGQTITLIGNIPATSSVSGGQVFAGSFGWYWPRR